MKTRSASILALLAGFVIGGVVVQDLHAAGDPVYVVTEVDVTDMDAYQKDYIPAAQATIRASGGQLIAAGSHAIALEGSPPASRVAINRFDSLEAVQAWRNSAQYKDARKIGDKYGRFRSFAVQAVPQ